MVSYALPHPLPCPAPWPSRWTQSTAFVSGFFHGARLGKVRALLLCPRFRGIWDSSERCLLVPFLVRGVAFVGLMQSA